MKILIVLAVAFLAVECRNHGKPEFYWRDFNGSIPVDALSVVMGHQDQVVYIGQGYLEGVGILPGMLQSGVMEMGVAHKGRNLKIQSNIKIMCTDSAHPDSDFQWIPVNNNHLEHVKSLQFLNVPAGGTADSKVVFIGRLTDAINRDIGQVNTVAPFDGLNIPNPRHIVFKNYELLALLNFDCDEVDSEDSSEEKVPNSSEETVPNTRGFRRH